MFFGCCFKIVLSYRPPNSLFPLPPTCDLPACFDSCCLCLLPLSLSTIHTPIHTLYAARELTNQAPSWNRRSNSTNITTMNKKKKKKISLLVLSILSLQHHLRCPYHPHHLLSLSHSMLCFDDWGFICLLGRWKSGGHPWRLRKSWPPKKPRSSNLMPSEWDLVLL